MANDVYDYYYENYLMLYSMYGRGRPRLNRERYEELDRELLDLVGEVPSAERQSSRTKEFTRDTFNRVRELEYLLLDDLSEALLDRGGSDMDGEEETPPAVQLEFTWSDDVGSHTP